jgi:hypothetical protein
MYRRTRRSVAGTFPFCKSLESAMGLRKGEKRPAERDELSHAVATRFLQCVGVLIGQLRCRKSCISVLRPTNTPCGAC